MILETAIQDDKVMQDFELESLPRGVIILIPNLNFDC